MADTIGQEKNYYVTIEVIKGDGGQYYTAGNVYADNVEQAKEIALKEVKDRNPACWGWKDISVHGVTLVEDGVLTSVWRKEEA